MAISAETFFLDPEFPGTLQQQIQSKVAEGILAGRFRPGEKLPSSRGLARHLGISRITVTLAYTELLADDYITARGRSGYYVSANAPRPPRPAPSPKAESVDWSRALGQRFALPGLPQKPRDWRRYPYPFIYGQADESLFDRANWRLCALQALGARDFDSLTGDQFDGDDPELLDFLARQILPRRGIVAGADEILVTMGAQNALWLAAQVLLTQRRQAAVENPSYPFLQDILRHTRCHVAPVAVDDDGLPPEDIPEGTDVVFTTPSHQCPTNATMPLARRRRLLDRASQEDWLIVEDDYEFEVSFLGAPLPALKSLDKEGRVIYVGSFSKSLCPGIRLGYLVGAPAFIREARALRMAVLRHPPGHIQRTAAYFMTLGHYDALLKRMGHALHDRRNVIDRAIVEYGLTVAGRGAFGGSSLWMRAPDQTDTERLGELLQDSGVLIEPGRPFFLGEDSPKNYYRLAYSSISTPKIGPGMAKLAEATLAMQQVP